MSERPNVCRRCYGPCRSHKGSVHGWTCAACLRDLIGDRPFAPIGEIGDRGSDVSDAPTTEEAR